MLEYQMAAYVIVLMFLAFLAGAISVLLVLLPKSVRRYNEATEEAIAWETLAKSYKVRIDRMLNPSLPPDLDIAGVETKRIQRGA